MFLVAYAFKSFPYYIWIYMIMDVLLLYMTIWQYDIEFNDNKDANFRLKFYAFS
jgi:hypothetical protein